MKYMIFLCAFMLLLAACSSDDAMVVVEDDQADVQEVPAETVQDTDEPETTTVTPTQVTPTEVSDDTTESTETDADEGTPSKTEELLAPMYEKIEQGVSFRNKGDTIYLKGPEDAMKMTIAFGQMYTIPGSQRTDYALADQIDLAYFDLATGKGRGYCLGRIEGSEFACNDLQDKGFDLKYSDFIMRNALYYLEQNRDVDPDVFQKRAERVQGVATARAEYGQGRDQVIVWISDFHKMPIKVAQRIKDPYTQETHYEDWTFGVSDDIMTDPFA